jgi:hypothetical protein
MKMKKMISKNIIIMVLMYDDNKLMIIKMIIMIVTWNQQRVKLITKELPEAQ